MSLGSDIDALGLRRVPATVSVLPAILTAKDRLMPHRETFLKEPPPAAADVPGSLVLNIKKVAPGDLRAMKTSSHPVTKPHP